VIHLKLIEKGGFSLISREEIQHIYALAKLELKEEEIDEVRRKFSDILDFTSKILEVKTPDDSLEMLAKAPCKMREDIPEESYTREDALKHALETEYGYFRLNRVVE